MWALKSKKLTRCCCDDDDGGFRLIIDHFSVELLMDTPIFNLCFLLSVFDMVKIDGLVASAVLEVLLEFKP